MGGEQKGWAVVTGASVGIGAVFARELVKRGYPVLAVARRKEKLDDLAAEAAAAGGRIEPLALDLQEEGSAQRICERALELGAVELLVNNAGYGHYGAFLDAPLDRLLGMHRLNMDVLVELTYRLLPPMLERRRGGVINLASIAAFAPGPFFNVYSATKAYVLSFSEALAVELKGTGVRVLAVCPGPVTTEFAQVAESGRIEKMLPALTPEAVVKDALNAFESGRVVKVQGLINWAITVSPKMMPRLVTRWVNDMLFRPPANKGELPPAS